ncbi:MAG: Lrp/AsnC family transcriptional regulator [Cohaesibacteraceae bacterium]|nr:Lrp/AsnC family transcriptional regulator [Cohaesibacteraceae bacterium]MBL4875545.1 Lrp/AsnC family transcriptional regulator [Cohaesibacteraceae bacterium]
MHYRKHESSRHVYDQLDRELIAVLRNDGRASVSRLAELLGVSRGTIQNRLDRLISSGAILGFSVRVREDQDTDIIRAIMMIEVEGKSTAQIVRKLRGMPEVHELHSTNGNWDLVAQIHTASLADFDRVLGDVRVIDGVLNSETSILLSSV